MLLQTNRYSSNSKAPQTKLTLTAALQMLLQDQQIKHQQVDHQHNIVQNHPPTHKCNRVDSKQSSTRANTQYPILRTQPSTNRAAQSTAVQPHQLNRPDQPISNTAN
ncbi:hypothetical protein LOK49_LG15G02544 [Camellia lanceoleosa]|uniref:Uncharacterized protein n=1 Tax=Camellia lanceoleosa TaxID=1840588 RepID=A0ACC0F6W2_9ERIC|nr:hypothetical protein LOK49_LG15G02544 [Camellia lanceoleosa]